MQLISETCLILLGLLVESVQVLKDHFCQVGSSGPCQRPDSAEKVPTRMAHPRRYGGWLLAVSVAGHRGTK